MLLFSKFPGWAICLVMVSMLALGFGGEHVPYWVWYVAVPAGLFCYFVWPLALVCARRQRAGKPMVPISLAILAGANVLAGLAMALAVLHFHGQVPQSIGQLANFCPLIAIAFFVLFASESARLMATGNRWGTGILNFFLLVYLQLALCSWTVASSPDLTKVKGRARDERGLWILDGKLKT